MLKGKRCVVTGASRGIGEAIAMAFSKEKASLVLVGRSQETLKVAADKCKAAGAQDVETMTCDMAKNDSIEQLIANLLKKPVDVLVNNAGVFNGPASAITLNMDKTDEMLQVNLHAPIRLINKIGAAMVAKKEGTIINIGSTLAIDTNWPNFAAYCASKFGLRGFHLASYEEFRKHNVKVMIIQPAITKTEMTSKLGADPDRMIATSDIAEAALLPFKTSVACCPVELVVRNQLNPLDPSEK
eukprot:Platyproteum_vivax@DN7571_c0_g1_i3.p1